jgi:hypothetical protein
MQIIHKIFSSRSSLIGLFSVISIMLTIPLAIVMSQQNQDLRQRAAGINTSGNVATIVTPTPTPESHSARTVSISGYVFYDDNQNGHRDVNEKPYPKVSINVTQVRRDGSVNARGQNAAPIAQLQSDANGYFTYTYRSNNQFAYTIKVILPTGYKTIDTNPLYIMTADADVPKVIEFGLFPYTKVLTASSCAPRPKCLDTTPACKIAEPTTGWCPAEIVITSPTPSKALEQHTPEVHGD